MIYKVRSDRNNYMNPYISPEEIEMILGDFFLLDEPIWANFWKPLPITFSDDSDAGNLTSIPDISLWGTTTHLICSAKAKQELESHLMPLGEWLPVTCEAKPYFLFHVTNRLKIEAIDVKNSTRSINATGHAEATKITLLPQHIKGNLLFTTEYDHHQNLYAGDVFFELLSKANLHGLTLITELGNGP